MPCEGLNQLFKETPSEEFYYSIYRTETPHEHGCLPCMCFMATIYHALSIGLRPVVNLVKSVVFFFFALISLACCNSHDAKYYAGKSLDYIACALISPFGQVIKTVSAFLGIFCPAAYTTIKETRSG